MIKKIVLTICLIFITSLSAAQGSQEDATLLFKKGGAAYKDSRYDEAVAIYEKIRQGGLENGPLYYNLGNSYFKQERFGKAILNYERAKRFMPRDPDLKANHRYAISSMGHPSANGRVSFWKRIVNKWTDIFTVNEFVLILFGLGLLVGTVHLLSLYLNWFKNGVVSVLVVLGFVFSLCLFGLVQKVSNDRTLGVVVNAADAKFEPRVEATVYFDLHEGGKIKILKEEGSWAKIQRFDGKTGWTLKDNVERIIF